MADSPETILVAGASGGIGRAMLSELRRVYPDTRILATHCSSGAPVADPLTSWHGLDLRDAESIAAFAGEIKRVDWLIICAGLLHNSQRGPEKTVRAVDPDFLIENVRVNTMPTLLLAKHFSAALRKSTAPLLATVSARVGSIEDNRLGGWYSYRLSKAALNMALKTLSIEWRHSHPRGCVAALHPGTNNTALSKPFQANVPPSDLLQPSESAKKMVGILQQLSPGKSGKFWAWNGEELPW